MVVPLAACMAVWVGAFVVATRGLDMTDEAYYLLAIAHPGAETATVRLFGFVYHPLWVIANGDIVAIRWIGMLLSGLATGTLGWFATRRFGSVGRAEPTLFTVLVGTSSLFAVVQFPLSPGYNALALQAVALTGVGVILGTRTEPRAAQLGWALVGVAVWAAFLAKPTTAVVVAVLALIPLAVSRHIHTYAGAALGGGLAAAGVTLAAIGKSPLELVTMLRAGAAAVPGHDSLVRLAFPHSLPVDLGVACAALPCLLLAAHGPRARWLRSSGAVALAGVLVLGWQVWHDRGMVLKLQSPLPASALIILLLTGALLAVGRSRSRDRPTAVEHLPAGNRWAIGSFLGLAPFAVSFGTNNNLWSSAGRASALWAVAAIVLLGHHSPRAKAAVIVPAVGLAALGVAATFVAPYRTAPYASSTAHVAVTMSGARLGVDPATAERAAVLLRTGRALGIGPETRVIDLTGANPGVVAQLEALPVGEAWLIGGYPDSERAAVAALRSDPCGVADALLLRSETAARRLPDDVLSPFGLAVPDDYEVIGHLPVAHHPWPASRNGVPPAVDVIDILRRTSPGPVVGCGL